ncbi:hypothetical protein DCC62_11330 [candidate division KSB1 bacterium]|nr:MAG: hypothetical protein DCC62_11330 [candidate division KSB1 bacterium]
MDIKVHRAGDVYFAHFEVLLNQPSSEISSFLNIEHWQAVAAAAFWEMPEVEGISIQDFANKERQSTQTQFNLSEAEIQQFRAKGFGDEQIEQFRLMQTQLVGIREEKQHDQSPAGISRKLQERTGVPEAIWKETGLEMLEAVLTSQAKTTSHLFTMTDPNRQQIQARSLAQNMGISRLSLAADFPMTHISFGFSRVAYEPNQCRLNSFPADADHQGKFPIFVDLVQADAVLIQLDVERLWRWLELNGYTPSIPTNASDPQRARKAYFVRLLTGVPLRLTLKNENPEARMIFGLLHTMSHFFVRKAALLCGLDRTSLSEYVLPRALTFAIYCNHRFGATIGALSSLFEQSLPEWLGQIKDETRRCIYDPVCYQKGGNCHACTHLAETSCRYFNINLSRSFLFGGPDPELGEIRYGYWNMPE